MQASHEVVATTTTGPTLRLGRRSWLNGLRARVAGTCLNLYADAARSGLALVATSFAAHDESEADGHAARRGRSATADLATVKLDINKSK